MNLNEASTFRLTSQPFGLQFHPDENLILAGCISGAIELINFRKETPERVWRKKNAHVQSCRAVCFLNAEYILSASSDGTLLASNVETGAELVRIPNAHNAAVNSLHCLGPGTVASGDDNGCIKTWDSRQSTCSTSLDVHSDYISAMEYIPASSHLLSSSGDGSLAIVNLRRNKVDALSDSSDEDMTGVTQLKEGTKVVGSTQEGSLQVFNWPNLEECTERYQGHPSSIESLLKVDQDSVLTGSLDGHIRLVSILPTRVSRSVGVQLDRSVEILASCSDTVASGSLDKILQLWRKVEVEGEGTSGQGDKSIENDFFAAL